VVDGQQQRVAGPVVWGSAIRPRAPHLAEPQQRRRGQVEGSSGLLVVQRLVAGLRRAGREGAQVGITQGARGLRRRDLVQHAVGHGEAGAQRIVAGDDVIKRSPQRGGVQDVVSDDLQVQVVLRRPRHGLVDGPEPALCGRRGYLQGDGHDAAGRDGGAARRLRGRMSVHTASMWARQSSFGPP
jgi:hypothetical protein